MKLIVMEQLKSTATSLGEGNSEFNLFKKLTSYHILLVLRRCINTFKKFFVPGRNPDKIDKKLCLFSVGQRVPKRI